MSSGLVDIVRRHSISENEIQELMHKFRCVEVVDLANDFESYAEAQQALDDRLGFAWEEAELRASRMSQAWAWRPLQAQAEGPPIAQQAIVPHRRADGPVRKRKFGQPAATLTGDVVDEHDRAKESVWKYAVKIWSKTLSLDSEWCKEFENTPDQLRETFAHHRIQEFCSFDWAFLRSP